MKKETITMDEKAKLRKQAEAELEGQPEGAEDLSFLSPDAKDRLLHELRVHQIELEMQNDELRRVQLELEAARDKYSDLYDFSPVGYFTISEKGIILQANLTGAAMLGVERRSLMSQPFSRFVTGDTQDVFYHHHKKLHKTKSPRTCTLKLKNKDNTEFHARLECFVLEDNEGHLNCFEAVSNINDRKQMEDTLRKNENRHRELYNLLRLIADNGPDFMWAKDMKMRYVFANKAMCKRLLNARDTDEPIGKTHMYFANRERKIHPGDPLWNDFGEACIDSDSFVMKTKKAQRFDEFGNVRGKYLHLDVYKAPLLDDQGNMMGIVGSVRDVTEGKVLEMALLRSRDELERRVAERTAELLALQEELIRSERLAASGQLAGVVAHEINSPLQAITILLSTMEERWKDDAELMESVDILEGAFLSVGDTVKNLLDLNRPGKDEKQQTHVNRVLKQTLDLVESNLARNKIKVNPEVSPEIPAILASPQQLNHLFLNLINNAVEAVTGESGHENGWEKRTTGGEINISTMLSEGNIVIRVADNGPGIWEEDLHKIFDPFHTRKKKMGMGVGLSICQGFVEDHGGTIQAENRPEGGTVFTITLPC